MSITKTEEEFDAAVEAELCEIEEEIKREEGLQQQQQQEKVLSVEDGNLLKEITANKIVEELKTPSRIYTPMEMVLKKSEALEREEKISKELILMWTVERYNNRIHKRNISFLNKELEDSRAEVQRLKRKMSLLSSFMQEENNQGKKSRTN